MITSAPIVWNDAFMMVVYSDVFECSIQRCVEHGKAFRISKNELKEKNRDGRRCARPGVEVVEEAADGALS